MRVTGGRRRPSEAGRQGDATSRILGETQEGSASVLPDTAAPNLPAKHARKEPGRASAGPAYGEAPSTELPTVLSETDREGYTEPELRTGITRGTNPAVSGSTPTPHSAATPLTASGNQTEPADHVTGPTDANRSEGSPGPADRAERRRASGSAARSSGITGPPVPPALPRSDDDNPGSQPASKGSNPTHRYQDQVEQRDGPGYPASEPGYRKPHSQGVAPVRDESETTEPATRHEATPPRASSAPAHSDSAATPDHTVARTDAQERGRVFEPSTPDSQEKQGGPSANPAASSRVECDRSSEPSRRLVHEAPLAPGDSRQRSTPRPDDPDANAGTTNSGRPGSADLPLSGAPERSDVAGPPGQTGASAHRNRAGFRNDSTPPVANAASSTDAGVPDGQARPARKQPEARDGAIPQEAADAPTRPPVSSTPEASGSLKRSSADRGAPDPGTEQSESDHVPEPSRGSASSDLLVPAATRPHIAARPEPNGTPRKDQRETATEASSPTVRVTIGRVEVRAAPATPPPARRSSGAKPGPALSLDDYLKQRKGGRR